MNQMTGATWSLSESASLTHPGATDLGPRDERSLVLMSGLFDETWYREEYHDIVGDPLADFMTNGWRERRLPNPYFDTHWYLQQNPEIARAGKNPLVDYIVRGEAACRAPSAYFDLLWYRARHTVAAGGTLLRHFLERRLDGIVSPLAEFDPGFYLTTYPDIAHAKCDPFWHFYKWGWTEGRNPSAAFNTKFYVQRYWNGQCPGNPLLLHRQIAHWVGFRTVPAPEDSAVFEEVRRFTRPGPAFERFVPLPRAAPRRAKLLAFYLPQFHASADNDAFWGDGFTEWTSVQRGQPRFLGHYQPRTPRDLGHYSLDDPATIRRQIAMARDAGLFGFIVYFYWFNGRRLLEKPLEALLADASLNFPFCLMWANENWTRRWDGSEDQVLISQDYRAEDDIGLIDSFARHFRDPRYIRIDGRPLLMVYRPRLIPHTRASVSRWRALFAERHGEHPILVMAQSFGELDPRPLGFDGAVEFPPHKLTVGRDLLNPGLTQLDPAATAQVFAYDDVANASVADAAPPYPLMKTAVPGWDNDARRQGAGLVLHGSSPARYQAWLEALIDRTAEHRFFGERMVCVNAWNEWAEGAYLEPDVHFGAAYANATGRAVTRLPPTEALGRMLLVGHDAYPAGAQHLLLHLGRTLRRAFGVQVEFLLLDGGALRAEYEAVAPTTVSGDTPGVEALLAAAVARGVGAVLVNTAAAAWVAALAARAGPRAIVLIHEMPRFLKERALLQGAAAGAEAAARVVFPAACVAEDFAANVPCDPARRIVLPQGCYRPVTRDAAAAAIIRARLGLAPGTRLILGIGTGDLRKGFDLFLQTWRASRRRARGAVAFAWIGAIDSSLRGWLGSEIADAESTGTFHAPGFQGDLDGWLSAASALALTSREDPFPTVVLEAISAGVPVAAFAGGGGAPELIVALDAGMTVPMADAESMAEALDGFSARDWDAETGRLAAAIRDKFDFTHYAAALLKEAQPNLPSISVAVPSCDYARYMGPRLGSVFAQTVPVREVLVLDDASTDDSVAVAREVARDWRRDVSVVSRETRTGSAFGQWTDAVERATGDWIWIAEADDAAEPGFLARIAAAIAATPDLVMAICDSAVIDADGKRVWPSYQAYYAESGAAHLSRDMVMAGKQFARRFLAERNLLLNASAVVWRRDALRAALERCGRELPSWRLAGDWRVYLEVLAQSDAPVAWIADPLNVHRRHGGSVTGASPGRDHLREIVRMHRLLVDRLDLDAAAVARQAAYRAALSRQFGGRDRLSPARRAAGARSGGNTCR